MVRDYDESSKMEMLLLNVESQRLSNLNCTRFIQRRSFGIQTFRYEESAGILLATMFSKVC